MKVVIKKTKINYKENIKNIYKELTLYIYIYITYTPLHEHGGRWHGHWEDIEILYQPVVMCSSEDKIISFPTTR